ncbi:alpha-D-ribose 1-methylphosphonate 5-triphosphate diphosphatase [Phaeobacter sp. C3_T13_0]|uniref:alpha-D-ribose 1-methylphosphonate 5-triphosphate diphosphatase n=1 Tax=Phaeobacter cretensis TaxID=3342641 RepID=UPI0039BCAA9C
MQNWIIKGGTCLLPSGLETTDIGIKDGQLYRDSLEDAQVFDASDYLVLPGIVDAHGDGFERVVNPRPNVHFPLPLALQEADSQLIANGITTAFHGLSASWEPGLRSVETGRQFLAALSETRDLLACDTHINLRWELFCLDHLDEIETWLEEFPTMVLSLNDHLTAYKGLDVGSTKISRLADRAGLPPHEAIELINALSARAGEIPAAVDRMATAAQRIGNVMFAHDELSPEQRAANKSLGVSVSEFPMTWDTARSAIRGGDSVVLGAPNVVRGGTQNNAIDAEPAIAEDLCTVLASDYYYPAQLAAAFALVDRGTVDLGKSWALVSSGPARAVGLSDRGEIRDGLRGDLIVLHPQTRQIRAVFVDGRKVLEREKTAQH